MKSKSKNIIAISLFTLVICSISVTMASSENAEKAVAQEQAQKSNLKNHSIKRMNTKKVLKQSVNSDNDHNKLQLRDNEWPLCIPTIGHTCPP